MTNKILLVGGGGREDAVARKIVESGSILYSALKNENPSIIKLSREHLICDELDYVRIAGFAAEKGIDLAFIGPDPVLETPLVDILDSKGIRVASPSKDAARIETSKAYMRRIVAEHRIDGNIFSELFHKQDEVEKFLSTEKREFAIKPVGLTGGKGVKVMGEHLKNRAEAMAYAAEVLSRDGQVLLEERIRGEEFSLQVFTDGKSVLPAPLAQDYKRAYENDLGPNTGGMGSITDSDGLLPFISRSTYEKALNSIKQTVSAMASENTPFRGIMYGQFMDTENGPKIIEINARFADPESLNILSLFRGNFTDVLFSIADGSLKTGADFMKKATTLKYLVPVGYGTMSKPGTLRIDGNFETDHLKLYYAAVSGTMTEVRMSGSRALALVGIADTIPDASDIVENSLKYIRGDYSIRHDIGTPAMIGKKMERFKKA